MKTILIFLICFANSVFSQGKYQKIIKESTSVVKYNFNPVEHMKGDFNYPSYFQPQGYSIQTSFGLKTSDNKLLQFWIESGIPSYLYISRSSNNGLDWSTPEILQTLNDPVNGKYQLAGIRTQSNEIIVSWVIAYESSQNSRFYKISSSDNGNTWSSMQVIGTGISSAAAGKNGSFNQSLDGVIWFTYNKSDDSLYYRKSTDNGSTWSAQLSLHFSGDDLNYGAILSLNNQNLGLVYLNSDISGSLIKLRKSTDNGASWSLPEIIFSDTSKITNMKTINTFSGKVYVIFQNSFNRNFITETGNSVVVNLNDIVYVKTTNGGNSWSSVQNFTLYKGFDGDFGIGIYDDKPFVSFLSARFNGESQLRLWQGIVDFTNDLNAPPAFFTYDVGEIAVNIPITINVLILSTSPLTQVELEYKLNNDPLVPVLLYDDGQHNDSESNDDIWGNSIGPFIHPYSMVSFKITINDQTGNYVFWGWGGIDFTSVLDSTHLLNKNKITLPVVNNGVMGTSYNLSNGGGIYEGGNILYSGGFYLSGVSNGLMWANGVAPSSLVLDYLPGNATEIPSQSSMKIYGISTNDPTFGSGWFNWSDAVDLGADFYDGDNDGFYNPLDLNSNSMWDLNEDRPGLIGNETLFFVYNDAVPSGNRIYSDVEPQGVEIQQTTYLFANPEYNLDRTIFIKYKIVNKSNVEWDSLYFTIYTDPDIGENYMMNLAGSDTVSSSTFAYKSSSDPSFGQNPPAFFSSILQGPVVFIPGETFIDNNQNGIYEEGIDTPLDSAFNIRGTYIGIDTIPGAKNLKPNSSSCLIGSHWIIGDPYTKDECRNLQFGGIATNGEIIDPCSWSLGFVNNVNCNEVNPKFLYSGDPELNTGWINNYADDIRTLITVGPFSLVQNSSNQIVAAYHVNRGSLPLNSVTVGKHSLQEVITAYRDNFPVIVSVNGVYQTPNTFSLFQNYPNPFNPSTKIKYSIPSNVKGGTSKVVLKIFDILGREVATLVNEEKQPGVYEVEFDGSALSSGIFFYTLTADEFKSTMKFVLLK